MEVTKNSNDAEKLLEKLTLDSPSQISAAATLEILESKPKVSLNYTTFANKYKLLGTFCI